MTHVLVAAPAQTARTVGDVIAQLKARPGAVTFASSGNGASDHLSAEVFWQQTITERNITVN
jgi:tripartite-type tricarboxylate transporter receptor subunit TctC